jgi:type II restriction/modification system DNA methylase subunit YeeA
MSAFVGGQKDGPFELDRSEALALLGPHANPNGRPNSDVLRPWCNGRDLAQRSSDTWIIDFGDRSEEEAALYEAPFRLVEARVKPIRDVNRDQRRRRLWWIHGRPGSKAKAALGDQSHFLATPLTSKHRWFVFLPKVRFPDNTIVLIARSDWTTFGVLSSRLHVGWAIRVGNFLGVGNDPRYTPTTTFETFPFPEGLTPNIPASMYASDPRSVAIANAARELHEKREAWLNPSEWVDRVPEIVPGYPERIVPKDEAAAMHLKNRTLTKLYNERPAWLEHAHNKLDATVAAAYGLSPDMPFEDMLSTLFQLNATRAEVGR